MDTSSLPGIKSYSIPVTRNYENESYKAAPITFEVSGSVMVGGTPVAGVVLQGLQGIARQLHDDGQWHL